MYETYKCLDSVYSLVGLSPVQYSNRAVHEAEYRDQTITLLLTFIGSA